MLSIRFENNLCVMYVFMQFLLRKVFTKILKNYKNSHNISLKFKKDVYHFLNWSNVIEKEMEKKEH